MRERARRNVAPTPLHRTLIGLLVLSVSAPPDTIAAQSLKKIVKRTISAPMRVTEDLSSVVRSIAGVSPASALVAPNGSRPRPQYDVMVKSLYGTDARLETLKEVSPTLAMVWLARDSADARGDLPFRVFGRHPETNREMALIPVVDHRSGMRYNSAGARYEGEVLIGFRDSLAPTGVITLAQPLVIGVGGTVETVEPKRLEIGRINQIDTHVKLSSGRRPTGAVLNLHPEFSVEVVSISIPVLIDSLSISVDRSMRGLGAEEVEVGFRVPAGSLGPTDSIAVTVRASKGKISPSHVVYVKENASASVRLRSAGIGTERLTFESGPMAADDVIIDYTVPWVLLIIAIVGAVVGTLLRWWKARAKDPKTPIPWPRVAVALLVLAAMSVGLETVGLGFAVGFSEIGVFVMAAVFAGGVSILRWKDSRA